MLTGHTPTRGTRKRSYRSIQPIGKGQRVRPGGACLSGAGLRR